MKTFCCSDICERRNDCARHCIGNNDALQFKDYYCSYHPDLSYDDMRLSYECGELGDWKMFEQSPRKWIQFNTQILPIDEVVEVKVLCGDEERIYINKLIRMPNQKYVWKYYNDNWDKLIAWRKMSDNSETYFRG